MQWVVATAAFFASAVEFVEAFTIVLVVGVTVNWRSALLGALAAAATLALLVATLGVAIVQWVPIDLLRLVIGVLLLLFGMRKNASVISIIDPTYVAKSDQKLSSGACYLLPDR